MARIRAIKPRFFKHGVLFDAEKESGFPLRVAFAGLWCVADREGRFRWDARELKTDILPYDDCRMEDVLAALAKWKFIVKYKVAGVEYGHIPSFLEHQHINKNESPSTLPEPPKNVSARARTVNARAETDILPQPEGQELVVRKGMEGEETLSSVPASERKSKNPLNGHQKDFAEWYAVFPKHEAKADAMKAYAKALTRASSAILLDGARRYASARKDEDYQYTKLPATWLRKDCWLDEASVAIPGIDPELARLQEIETEHRKKMGFDE